ncbi:MAG: hypothetical protein JXA99_09710 [Candidatus Lokiarchaeota archaeon]|nr:hypothetical protein [Candidatus Lokiarchaeota archaeon]
MENVNLETIFYYISIFKMINGDLPANISLILSIVENQSNKKLFYSRYNDTPDIINNFYGLAIISETIKMNMNIIDLNILNDLLNEELKHFNENKFLYNYYLFNCINLLKKFDFNINIDRIDLLKRFSEIRINNTEYNEFIYNFYRLISISKLLDTHFDYRNVNNQYLKKLDKIFNELEVSNYNLTECSQLLLILDMLTLREKYAPQIKLLLNKLITNTKFFMSEIQDEDFSWKNDITAFKVEVKILYWTLITSVQYQSFIQKNFS